MRFRLYWLAKGFHLKPPFEVTQNSLMVIGFTYDFLLLFSSIRVYFLRYFKDS